MTDLRRIELSSVKTSEKEPKVKRKVKTVRLVLSLGESNATSCPEYSFADLIKAENDKSNENLDPFGDNDEEREVAAIAQRFEAKYGTKSLKSGKKQQTQDMDDYYDVGDGYDEDDPFIDNTEAYDEVVPSTLTTKYGGFYINQGKLDFKSISEDSNDSFAVEDKSKKKLKRKQLDSDSEDETPEALAKKFKAIKRKKQLEGLEAEKKKKKLGLSLNGDVSIIKKKKKKNLLKLKQASRDSLPKKEDNSSSVSVLPKQATTTAPVVTTAPAVTTTPPVPPATATPTSVVVTNVSTTVSTLNGNNNMSTNEEKSSVVEDVSMKEPANVVINIDDSSSKSGDEEKKPEATNEEKNTQLPSSLPPKLAEDIAKIKQLAKMSTESKSKFFSGNTNKLLLTIENESFKLSKSERSAIFNHLAEHLPTSGKTALLRRAKKLRQAQYETPLKVPLEKLREAVKLAMPKAIEEHQLIIAKAKLEAKSNGADTTTEDAATESDEDENKTADTKKTRMPRRKFSWTPEIIDLFLKVVEVKMGVYNTLKSKLQPPDEYLKAFFEAEVKPIWPNNWMNTRALLKLHREETSKGVKKRNVSGKMSPVPSSDPPLNPSQQLVSKMNSIMEVSNKKGGDMEESKRSNNICMTDDIIEISSIIDDDVEEKKNVVINLPDSEVKSSLPIMNLQQSQSRSTSSVPSSTTNTHSGQIKPESKAIPNKSSSSSSSSGTVSDHLYNSVKKLPDKTGMGNMASQPIVVPESPKSQPATPLRMGTVISTPIPKAASTPVLTGSGSNTVTTSSIPLNNRSFLHALDPPTLHKEGPLPSKPHVSLLSPQQQQQQQQKSTSNLLNTVLQSYQPQQKQLPKKFQPSPSSSSSQIRNNIQLPTKTGSSLSLQHQQEQQKIRPSKESKLTLMPPKSTISSYPVVNSNINTSSPSSKDLLNPVVRATPIPATTLAAYKQAASLSITNKGLGAAASQANHQGNNKLSFANQQQQHQQSQPQQKPPFNLSTQQQKQKQFQVVKQAGGQGQSQITVVSPPNSQLQQTNRKSNSAAINTSPLANSGGTPKQSPMRQQQQQKSPLPSSPHSVSNYIASKNNQFMLNNKSSPVNALQSSLPAGSQVKSGIVLGTTLPKFKPQSNSPNISRNSNNSATKPLTIQTSTFSAPSVSPSSIFSLSRTSTPSPQKSPGSPGITASSLLDHIQSQMLKEATQDQGLKVLAMAMNTKENPN